MKRVLLLLLLLTACGETPYSNTGHLAVTSAGGKVVAYRTAWKQGYVLSPNGGSRSFKVTGRPTDAFTTPDQSKALLLDRDTGNLTAVDVSGSTVAHYVIRTNRDLPEFSPDSRFVLWHASGRRVPSGTFDPNELSLVDLETQRSVDLSVGTNPKAIAFYSKDDDPRMLLFSPGKMTQIRLEQVLAAKPEDDSWKQTRDLSPTVNPKEVPRVVAQTGTQLYLAVAGLKEFVTVDLSGKEDLPPVNFEINDVKSPVWLTLSPPVPATAETVFFRDNPRETRFLYVLNGNKTLTVYDTNDLSRSRIIDLTYAAQAPDTVVATPDGKRVLMYKRTGATALYRMNVRTGNISTIPFKYPVAEFVLAPDGQSIVAIHAPSQAQYRPSFTYVNFKEVFDPILLPDSLAEYAITGDGRYIVFNFYYGEPVRKFDLRLGLLDEERHKSLSGYEIERIGALGKDGGVFAWLDDPGGRVAFMNLDGTVSQSANFVVDGILDR